MTDAPAGGKDRMWVVLCHLSAFAGYFFPLGNVLGPLVIYLMKREADPLVDEHGKESLNFQISITIYAIVSAVLILIFVGIPLFVAVLIADIVLVIIAAIKASNGESFRYPLTIRFVK